MSAGATPARDSHTLTSEFNKPGDSEFATESISAGCRASAQRADRGERLKQEARLHHTSSVSCAHGLTCCRCRRHTMFVRCRTFSVECFADESSHGRGSTSGKHHGQQAVRQRCAVRIVHQSCQPSNGRAHRCSARGVDPRSMYPCDHGTVDARRIEDHDRELSGVDRQLPMHVFFRRSRTGEGRRQRPDPGELTLPHLCFLRLAAAGNCFQRPS